MDSGLGWAGPAADNDLVCYYCGGGGNGGGGGLCCCSCCRTTVHEETKKKDKATGPRDGPVCFEYSTLYAQLPCAGDDMLRLSVAQDVQLEPDGV